MSDGVAPPPLNGVGASRITLPAGAWPSLLAFLVARFPEISADTWRSRFARGRVLDNRSQPLTECSVYRAGDTIHYYRELASEPRIPFEAQVLFQDAHLLVVDKPHFLPVIPAGRYVQESLLVRLKQALALDELVPLHRIDRGTAGLVLFSIDPATRSAYQQLFPLRAVIKEYEALAPHLAHLAFPLIRRSRILRGEPFFRMQEEHGEPNSETRVDIIERHDALSLYQLHPVTGRKHQLRVHMAAMGAPIVNDNLYPRLNDRRDEDHTRPLQLLARGLHFIDPISGQPRSFRSRLSLQVG